MDELIQKSGEILLQNGVIGVVVIGLFYYVLLQRAELRDLRAAHRTELAEKDKLVNQLQEARLGEMRSGFEIAKTNQITLAALTSALQGRRHGDR